MIYSALVILSAPTLALRNVGSSPQSAISSPLITSAPSIPGLSIARKHSSSGPSACTAFPKAVAAASARAGSCEITVAASAKPKLMDGPTVPELVQMPIGALCAGSSKARSRMGELPAYIPTIMAGRLEWRYLRRYPQRHKSAPESIIAKTANLAMTPATAAMGPMPKTALHSIICFTISGASSAKRS